ncbi:hypothetical protein RHSIM_Rhsim07G0168300 [Rhododendron simsii]|uniref:AAA+ ATPase domain-containing protein n=1 Tax=Rhododendron simsii TaxID=118357 RepID=A0A834GP61_RHOSS|nr:hypothetical protein RHSIM_Rhsim07G0168300 [Rhododendron simsii]
MALECVLSIGEKLTDPIRRQFGYLIHYKRNLESIGGEVDMLEERRGAVELLVDNAKRKGQLIGPDVEGWMSRVGGLSSEASCILEQDEAAEAKKKRCLNGWWWCPTLESRYSLSRKAKKKVVEVAKLREDGNFTQVSYLMPPPGIQSRPTDGIKGFKSRSSILKKVMEALKEDGVSNMVGVCGMGGVGKTTLVEEVAKKAKEEKLFDDVVMAVVSQNPEVRKIQGEIADLLGFQFEQETESGRGDNLREQMKCRKTILVILDDVWKRLELKHVGIPFGDAHKGCKILVTSRSEEVCNDMGAQKKFTVQVLPKEEAWSLFCEMAGISEEQTNFQPMKMAVANECRGLPIAIVTVGRALKGKDEPSWRSALAQLCKSNGKNIRGVEANVFRPLEWSYNYLESEEAKRCFLLCSLFPENSDIPKEDIVRYGIGLELFRSIDSVGEARDRMSLYQLHPPEHSFMVKTLKEWPENERRGNYAIISMICPGMRGGLPQNLEFPKLQLLRLESDRAIESPESLSDAAIESPETLYQGMKELKVVHMSSMYVQPLLRSIQCLSNLQTLSLHYCYLADKDLLAIEALKNLEILSFTGSTIEELPREIGNLNRLKLLDFLNCDVTRIPHGVLSSLSKLEELYLGVSFAGWDVVEEGKDIILTNACIAELASLPNLVALDIYVPNIECWVWPRDVVFLGNIRAFHICFGKSSRYIDECLYPSTNRLTLKCIDISHGAMEIRGLEMLFKITRILCFNSVTWVKHNICDLDNHGLKNLSELQVVRCLDLECLINTINGPLAKEAFCALKTLYLSILPELMHLWKGPTQLACLRNLTDVTVYRCPKLEYCVFSLAIARNLMQLQNITLQDCDQLEVIVSNIGGGEHEIASAAAAAEEDEDEIQFPKLTSLKLHYLPNFTGFCKPMNAVKLPQLKHLELEDVPKINFLWPTSQTNYGITVRPLFNDKDTLSSIETLNIFNMDNLIEIWPGDLQALKLRDIEVHYCHKLSNILFPSNLIECMQNLERLQVHTCDSVEVAFDLCGYLNVGGEGKGPIAVALPCLAHLVLENLQNLTHVWANGSRTIQGFQNLRFLTVDGCSSLRILLSPFVAKLLVNLKKLQIRICKVMEAIVGWEQEAYDDVTPNTIIIFPQLTYLELVNLPLLMNFCPQTCTFQGSYLEKACISDCPAMESLPSAVQSVIDEQQFCNGVTSFSSTPKHD